MYKVDCKPVGSLSLHGVTVFCERAEVDEVLSLLIAKYPAAAFEVTAC